MRKKGKKRRPISNNDPLKVNPIILSFEKFKSANECLRNKYLKEGGFTAFISRYKLFRKRVVHKIPLDVSMEEFLNTFKSKNTDYQIKEAHKLKKKDKISKKLKDSESMCIIFKGERLPIKIKLWRCIVPIHAFIPLVEICFKCDRFGK